MATNTKNVIVGAASLFVSNGNSSNDAGRPATTGAALQTAFGTNTSGKSARAGLLASGSGYREVGFTTNGLEVSYEPVYGEVMVDQLLDAARLFKQTLKVMLKSELTEATLENLQLSWGQLENVYATDSTGTSIANYTTLVNNDSSLGISTSDSPAAVLNLAAGALGDAPVERVLIAVGQAPAQVGTTSALVEAGASTGVGASSPKRQKERIYVARRVVSIDTTMHALKRDAATVFPVNFRCLPDSDPAYAGSEYGVVIDRVFGAY
jgi:hypothetical protein